jgi:hypothetical protein
MKRLLDESTDELTRSLLVAGIEHRPPPGNKARVMMAIGAGSTLGLFSSNAFAWLGTTAGKVTAVGVAVGVAGAVFIAAPSVSQLLPSQGHPSRAASGQESGPRVAMGPSQLGASPSRRAEGFAPVGGPDSVGTSVPAGDSLAADEASVTTPSTSVSSLPSEPVLGEHTFKEPTSSGVASSGKTVTKKLSAWRERRLAARKRAALSKPSEHARVEPVAEAVSGVVAHAAVAPQPERVDLLASKDDLDSEVRLVDDMHWAARHNDRDALSRFLERYRETFPDGQLKKEVAEFAARLERSDTARAP